MELKDLKEGDKIYNLVYWCSHWENKSDRELRTVIIKKITKNRAYLKGGYKWTITEKMFNVDWFPTKKQCYERALKSHESELEDFKENVRTFKKEIKYLNKKLLGLR